MTVTDTTRDPLSRPAAGAGPAAVTGDPAALGALLLLADGRFPAGGHAHSAGAEAAITDGRIAGPDDLAAFVTGRLQTTGLVDAALAAATVHRLRAGEAPPLVLRRLDGEADARLAVEPLRASSRRLGRQLIRAAAGCWPGPAVEAAARLHPDGAHQSVALGAVAVSAGVDARSAAALSLHHALTTPLQAALRLGGLDPYAVAGLAARLSPMIAALAAEAVAAAAGPVADLPCAVGPLCDIAAVEHAGRPDRLFAT